MKTFVQEQSGERGPARKTIALPKEPQGSLGGVSGHGKLHTLLCMFACKDTVLLAGEASTSFFNVFKDKGEVSTSARDTGAPPWLVS